MLKQKTILICCMTWTCLFAVSCAEQEVTKAKLKETKIAIPSVECRRAMGNIRIDGRLNEPAWQKVDSLKVSFLLAPKEAEKVSATVGAFRYDYSKLFETPMLLIVHS